jgi:hypothetical protein
MSGNTHISQLGNKRAVREDYRPENVKATMRQALALCTQDVSW